MHFMACIPLLTTLALLHTLYALQYSFRVSFWWFLGQYLFFLYMFFRKQTKKGRVRIANIKHLRIIEHR